MYSAFRFLKKNNVLSLSNTVTAFVCFENYKGLSEYRIYLERCNCQRERILLLSNFIRFFMRFLLVINLRLFESQEVEWFVLIWIHLTHNPKDSWLLGAFWCHEVEWFVLIWIHLTYNPKNSWLLGAVW